MMNFQFRAPTPDEFSEVAQLSYENFVKETARSTGESAAVLKDRFGGPPAQGGDHNLWYLIEDGRAQLGYIWIQLNRPAGTAFCYDIYLKPQYRSQGLGRKVMIQCAKILRAQGIRSLELCVFEHNLIARRLYASLGFQEENLDQEQRQFTLSLNIKGFEL